MIFSEIYGAYYTVMLKLIECAIHHPIEKEEIRNIVERYAFGESVSYIETALAKEKWQLIKKDGTTPVKNVPQLPYTLLQRRWLKAILSDPRMKLFEEEIPTMGLEGVEPLFTWEDFYVYDKYLDGDDYEDEDYIRRFRLILDAIRNRYPLEISMLSRSKKESCFVVMPKRLEYSEKDDKFRLIGTGHKSEDTINLGRILSCKPYTKEFIPKVKTRSNKKTRVVEFLLVDERNALERVLLHFAHLKKQTEKLDEITYKVSLMYDRDDETEMVIRILSFGPVLKVTAPDYFVNLIKDRLQRQKVCCLRESASALEKK